MSTVHAEGRTAALDATQRTRLGRRAQLLAAAVSYTADEAVIAISAGMIAGSSARDPDDVHQQRAWARPTAYQPRDHQYRGDAAVSTSNGLSKREHARLAAQQANARQARLARLAVMGAVVVVAAAVVGLVTTQAGDDVRGTPLTPGGLLTSGAC